MYEFKSLINQKFGRLTILEVFKKDNQIYCRCICECGNIKIAKKRNLITGNTKSCECLQKEIAGKIGRKTIYSAINKNKTINNLSHTRLYRIWQKMKLRCYNPKHSKYKIYGLRGIEICEEWKNNFLNFYDWAINNGFDINKPWYECTLDRINVNGNYEPSNCRWATAKEQGKNKRNNHLVNYNNKVYCISELAEKLNLSNYEVKKYYA